MTRSYPIALVGTKSYQPAIAACAVGETVTVWHEPDNPYDADALAVTGAAGATIGYLPRDSWVHRAVFDEAKPVSARIEGLAKPDANWIVRIAVRLEGDPVSERAFVRA